MYFLFLPAREYYSDLIQVNPILNGIVLMAWQFKISIIFLLNKVISCLNQASSAYCWKDPAGIALLIFHILSSTEQLQIELHDEVVILQVHCRYQLFWSELATVSFYYSMISCLMIIKHGDDYSRNKMNTGTEKIMSLFCFFSLLALISLLAEIEENF